MRVNCLGLCLLFSVLGSLAASAQALDLRIYDDKDERSIIVVPYIFHSELSQTAVGAATVAYGFVQPQMYTVLAVTHSNNGTKLLNFFTLNTRVPGTERLYFNTELGLSQYGLMRSYTHSGGGGHRSVATDQQLGQGSEHSFYWRFRYNLPWGFARQNPSPYPSMQGGLPSSASPIPNAWNPLESGVTSLRVEPFLWSRHFDPFLGSKVDTRMAGVQFKLEYDNSDFEANPSMGSKQSLAYIHDWGGWGSAQPWSMWELSLSKYLPLAENKHMRQRVLALNMFVRDIPTWDESSVREGQRVFHRPPPSGDTTFGGVDHLRGFDDERFYDRSSLAYSAEYRVIPRWNPWQDLALLRTLDIPWWQLSVFAELGRVAPRFDVSELHRDMHWVVGAGARVFVEGIVVRMDFGVSKEAGALSFSVSQPF